MSRVDTLVVATFSLLTFLSSFVAAGFGAAALYLHHIKNGTILFTGQGLLLTIVLGLFVGYITDMGFGCYLNCKADDPVFIRDIAPMHDLIVAISGFLSPKLLHILESVSLEKVMKWILKK